jgi:hypothetical protein
LTDAMLRDDLGVTSGLQRTKILLERDKLLAHSAATTAPPK